MCKSPAKTILDSPYKDGSNFLGVAIYVQGSEVILERKCKQPGTGMLRSGGSTQMVRSGPGSDVVQSIHILSACVRSTIVTFTGDWTLTLRPRVTTLLESSTNPPYTWHKKAKRRIT